MQKKSFDKIQLIIFFKGVDKNLREHQNMVKLNSVWYFSDRFVYFELHL